MSFCKALITERLVPTWISGRNSVPNCTPKAKQQGRRSVLGRVTTSLRWLARGTAYAKGSWCALNLSWLRCPPCLNYTSGGAKPGDDLSSGSWFKIKRSNIWAEGRLPPTGARLKNGSRPLIPLPVKGMDTTTATTT